jgi:hypothetical protein
MSSLLALALGYVDWGGRWLYGTSWPGGISVLVRSSPLMPSKEFKDTNVATQRFQFGVLLVVAVSCISWKRACLGRAGLQVQEKGGNDSVPG